MNTTVTEKLAALRAALESTKPLEKENERYSELAAIRQDLDFKMRTAPDYTEAAKHRDELLATGHEFDMLASRYNDSNGRREAAWRAVLSAADEVTEPLRHRIDELAGLPVEIAGEEIEAPSARVHRDRIVQWQTAVATRPVATMRSMKTQAIEGAEIFEAAVAALGLIEGERKALEAAKAAYEKAVAKAA